MVASAVFLKTRYGAKKKVGAIILIGGAIVVAPAFRGASTGTTSAAAVLIYWASNIPMALSAVYKEWRFADSEVHVLYLTQYVSCFQLLFGFLLFPAQCLTDGVPLGTATQTFVADAVGVATGETRTARPCLPYMCSTTSSSTLLVSWSSSSAASLTAILYAVLLPLSTLAFGARSSGSIKSRSWRQLLIGLAVVLVGFSLYESDSLVPKEVSLRGRECRGRAAPSALRRQRAGSPPPRRHVQVHNQPASTSDGVRSRDLTRWRCGSINCASSDAARQRADSSARWPPRCVLGRSSSRREFMIWNK